MKFKQLVCYPFSGTMAPFGNHGSGLLNMCFNNRSLSDVEVVEGPDGVLGIKYNNTFVNEWRILETRLAIESKCSPAMLNRLRCFAGEPPSFHVVRRASKFCGLFWLSHYRINGWRVADDSKAWDAVVASLMEEVAMADLRQVAEWANSSGSRGMPPWQLGQRCIHGCGCCAVN